MLNTNNCEEENWRTGSQWTCVVAPTGLHTHSGQEGKQTEYVSWGSPWWIDQLIVEEGWPIEDDPLCPAHWLRYSRVIPRSEVRGLPAWPRGRVGWSTVWPASCVARFSPRFPPRGRSTPGFLSALQLAPAMCLPQFRGPVRFQPVPALYWFT